ncbi:MAG: hypothetical protein GTO63_24045 [Anaerolineae bacterium]|nr:hypothetical protein [Anaerolineae bacterium]NIN97794.1 hypothetical protein [Anaerolineae bacterium]NIQ80790.1 hypothetical protein [Anaerolineae bacterium]
MSSHDVPLDYANSIVYDLEKALWDERGMGGRFRVTTVGRDYFLGKCLPRIKTPDVETIIGTIEQILEEEGIVAGISHEVDGRLLRLKVEGCAHESIEQRLVAKGVEPFTCVPANLVVLAIEETLDRPVELAKIEVEDGTCQLLLVLFESRPTFD